MATMAFKVNSNQRRNGNKGRKNFGKRKFRSSNRTFGAFLKAPVAKVDSDGFTKVGRSSRPQKRTRFQSPAPVKRNLSKMGAFSVLARDDSPSPTQKVASPTQKVALPKVMAPKKVTGAWGKTSKSVMSDKPIVKPRVSFANDSTSLMKPTAAETREYRTDSPPNEFVEYPAEDEYLKRKSSKNAWRPKSVPQVKEEPKSAMPGTRAILDMLSQEPVPSYIGAWADAVDSDDESDDEEIVLDNMGRPASDNSAW
jgi:hypothetical protein